MFLAEDLNASRASNVVTSLHKLGLREANQQFSRAIKAVRAGKEVVLTERGRPIAVIKPIKEEATLK